MKEKIKNFEQMKKERLKSLGVAFTNTKCLSGVNIERDDSVRVLLLSEDLVLGDQESMEKNDCFFKAIGLAVPAIHKGSGKVELKEESSEYKETEAFLQKVTKVEELKLSKLIDKIEKELVRFQPYNTPVGFSYCLIREDVYKTLIGLEAYTFSGNDFKTFEENMNNHFQCVNGMKVDSERYNKPEFENIKEALEKTALESLKLNYIDDSIISIKKHFFRGKDLFLRCSGKNQNNLIRLFYALEVLYTNSISLTPVRFAYDDGLSMLQCIHNGNLMDYDYELKSEGIDYDVENMITVNVTDIEYYYKDWIKKPEHIGGVEIDFNGKDSVIMHVDDLFPLNHDFKGVFTYIKIINE